MFCKVALTCLLGITAINGRSIFDNYNFPIYPTQNTNEFYPGAAIPEYNPQRYGDTSRIVRVSLSIAPPSRHLLPPYEDYRGAQAYSNRIYRNELPAWQYRNEMPAQYEEVEQLAPQAYPYEVVNRVLPKVEEPTDFQPLETQLSAQEKQITQVADDVKSVQQTVSELEKYLEGVAAALVPQNKAKNAVIKISMNLVPKLGDVQTGSMSEKEIDKLISSMWGVDSTEANSSVEDKELDKLITSMTVEDSAVNDSAKKEEQLDDLLSSMLGGDSNESDSSKNDKELDKQILEDSAVNDSAREDKGLVNVISSLIVAKPADGDSEEKEKDVEKIIAGFLGDDYRDYANNPIENSDAEEEYGKKLDALLNQIFAEEAQEKEEKVEEEKIEEKKIEEEKVEEEKVEEEKIEEEKEDEFAADEVKNILYDQHNEMDPFADKLIDDNDELIDYEDYLMNKRYIFDYHK